MMKDEIGEERKRARKKALQLLERMDRTEKDMMDRLLRAGYSEEISRDALEYVKGFGYVNNTRYAENYIAGRIHEKSRTKILQELYQRGIDGKTAAEAWDRNVELEQPDEREMIRSVILKKYGPGAKLSEKEMRRLYGYLARRGFYSSDISHVLEELEITTVFGQYREGLF